MHLRVPALIFLLSKATLALAVPVADSIPAKPAIITIQYHPGHPANRFAPAMAFGAGIDGHEKGDNAKMLSGENVKAMLSAGLKSLTYRLRTELGCETWHWNPAGQWSDPRHQQGYWVSDSTSDTAISLSYGYRLPRRGNTVDQANDDGYSRIDDGDTLSFWKSNPYLDSVLTGDPDSLHPQWVVVDLGKEQLVNWLHIHWGNPYAERFKLEYALKEDPSFFNPYNPGMWREIKPEQVMNSKHHAYIRLFKHPSHVRFLRIVCYQSSHTCDSLADARDSLGYAIREIELGTVDGKGKTRDVMLHGSNRYKQSLVYVSSTDPWHRACDIDSLTEQPGVDFTFSSGLTNGLPVLFPSGIAYDVPGNARNLVSYLRQHHYAMRGLELGEEPDGQWMAPTDFGSLFTQFTAAMKAAWPGLAMGGPSFQNIITFADTAVTFTEKQWLQQFLAYLRLKRSYRDFRFLSFEWYPFDDVCNPSMPQLLKAPEVLQDAFKGLRPGIIPTDVPIYITELGYSVLATDKETRIEGGLLDADIVGQFLTLGGNCAYLYGYEPNEVIKENPCNWGNMMLFGMDDDGKIKFPTALYFAASLYSKEWTPLPNDTVQLFTAASSVRNTQNRPFVKAYPLLMGNGKWSLMIINKNAAVSYAASLQIEGKNPGTYEDFRLPADLYQFSQREYLWKSEGPNSRPLRSNPPKHTVLNGPAATVLLPPYSITILRQR